MAARIYAPAALRDGAQQELARRKFAHFVRYLWPVVEPKRALIWSWSLDAICDHVEAVHTGQIRNLLVNIPPRSLKSTIISVMFPCWEWLHEPSRRYLTASYDKKLAVRDAVRSRRVMLSPQYQALIAARGEDGEALWAFTGDQNEKSRYENNRTGFRVCTSPGSGTLGEGGDRILVDDPHNVKKVESDAQRNAVLEWWDEGMSTRGNDPRSVAKIIVMQRLHELDLSGHVRKQGGYEWLCLTTEYEPDHPARRTTTCIGFADPRTEAGELLAPERMGPDEVTEAKLRLGSAAFAAQHQQRPAPKEGLIFKRQSFRFYTSLPPKFDEVAQSWDLAFKGKEDKRTFAAEVEALFEPSFVVGQVWGRTGADVYLLDEERGQWDFAKTIPRLLDLTERYPHARKKLIEDKANGPALMSLFKGKLAGLIPIDPKDHGSKIQRALACTSFVEAQNVWLPHPSIAPWIDGWIDEVCDFPNRNEKDRVDAMTQILLYWDMSELAASIRKLKAMGSW